MPPFEVFYRRKPSREYGILQSVQLENDKLNEKATINKEPVELGSQQWKEMVVYFQEQRDQITELIEGRNEKSKNKYVKRVLETKKVIYFRSSKINKIG